MKAGEYRHRLTIEENTGTSEDATYREKVESWTAYLEVWAAVDTGASRQFWAAKQVHPELTHLITFRYRGDFDPSKEIRFTWVDGRDVSHTCYPVGPAIDVDNAHVDYRLACVEEI